ncbi:MAG TPA: DUF1361 domain-containing protein [Spirochaetota bacterium]|nr:DUF1361 domain-containing protein [Spirochaetota bacterium]
MGWNIFLAFVPFFISLFIFKKNNWENSKFPLKFLLVIFFILFYFFLPNSPYVLTDIIHLVRQIKDYRYFSLSDNEIIVFLIPQYLIFIFLGFSFYVLSFQRMLHFLMECNFDIVTIWIIKIINPFLMAIGIFLGRIYRFNSWDILSNSEGIIKSTIEGFSNFHFFIFIIFITAVIFIGFEILSIFYKSFFKNLFDINPKK